MLKKVLSVIESKFSNCVCGKKHGYLRGFGNPILHMLQAILCCHIVSKSKQKPIELSKVFRNGYDWMLRKEIKRTREV